MTKVIEELKVRTTRKTRQCDLCYGEIAAGEKYATACLVDGGIVWHTCEHPYCRAIMEKECKACDETWRDECFESECFARAIESFVCPFCAVVKECQITDRLKCKEAMEIAKRLYDEEGEK